MILANPTDDELNRAFAEKVAGITGITSECPWPKCVHEIGQLWGMNDLGWVSVPSFTRSFDAVLPWLEKCPYQVEILYCQTTCSWHCTLTGRFTSRREYRSGPQDTAQLAAIFSLLRAHGVGVEFTK